MVKRKGDTSDDSKTPTTPKFPKMKDEPPFLFSDFKRMLKDPDQAFKALEEFNQTAKDFPEETDFDIINEFCGKSSNGQEIFALLEPGKLKAPQLALIFTSLELILLHITDFFTKYDALAKNIVNTILATYMPKILFLLEKRHKAGQVKSGLRLLRAMVMVNEYCASDVLSQFNFRDDRLVSLYDWRDTKDPHDVRTCLIHFIISFLLVEDNKIIRGIIEQERSDGRGILSSIFYGMFSDKRSSIEVVLATILEKILLNRFILKTKKAKIFDPHVLKQLARLYTWKKPMQWNAKNVVQLEDLSDDRIKDRQVVLETVHSFMLQLCSSEHGIVFHDDLYGFSERNCNHPMTLTLTFLPENESEEFVDDLIINIVKTCPDQIHKYLRFIQISLSPKESKNWFRKIELLEKIYCTQPDVPCILTTENKHELGKLAEILLLHFIPPTDVWQKLFDEIQFKFASPLVRQCLLHFLAVVLQRIIQLLQHTKTNRVCGHGMEEVTDEMDITQLIKAATLKLIPDVNLIMNSWEELVCENKKFKAIKKKEKKMKNGNEETTIKEEIQDDQELDKAQKYKFALTVLRVLCLYRELSPSLTDNPRNLLKLTVGIEKLKEERESREDNAGVSQSSMLELYLLKLLSVSDSKKMLWTKESDDKQSVLYMVMKMYISQTDERVVKIMEELFCKMLISTGLFNSEEEITIWFQQLLHVNNESQNDVILFVSKVFNSYIRYPYPFSDRVLELSVSVESMIPRNDDNVRMSGDTCQLSKCDSGDKDDDFVDSSMQVEREDIFRPPFSAVIDAALSMMDENCRGVCDYMTKVVMKLFHLQVDPVPFCLLVDRYRQRGINNNTVAYVLSFNNSEKAKSFKMKKLMKSLDALSALLLEYYVKQDEMDKKEFLSTFKETLKTLTDVNLRVIVKQVLLYLSAAVAMTTKDSLCEDVKNAQFSVWMKILTVLMKKAVVDVETSENTKLESRDEESLLSEYEQEIKAFNVHEKTPGNSLDVIVSNIFHHPVFISYFLKTNADHKSDNISSVSHIVTENVAEYFDLLSPCFDKAEIGKSIVPVYLHKIMKTIGYILTSGNSTFLDSCVKILNCCEKVMTSKTRSKIINLLLNMDSEDFVSKEDGGLSKIGFFITEVLQQSLHEDKDCLRNCVGIKHFFNCVQHIVTGVDKQIQLCINLLTVHPQFALVISKEFLRFLMENDYPRCIDLVKLIVQYNSNLMDVIKVWFLENKPRITEEKYIGLVHVCLIIEHKFNSVVDRNFVDGIWKQYRKIFNIFVDFGKTDSCFTLPESEKLLCPMFYRFLQMGAIDNGYLLEFCSRLTAKIVSTKFVSVDQIQLLSKIKNKMLERADTDLQQELNKLFMTLIKCVIFSAKNISPSSLTDCLLKSLAAMSKDDTISASISEIREEWNQFVKVILKVHYKDYRTHKIISDLLPQVYSIGVDQSESELLSLSILYEMLFSHSAFLPVMLENDDDQLIESITDLLLCIAARNTKPLQSAHVAVLLGSFGGTLTLKDQKLLKLICVYESSGIALTGYRPFLWGKKAVVHHSALKSLGDKLWKHATVEQVLDNFDQRIMQKSIDNFPVRRKLSPEVMYVDINHKNPSECYDPCFVLPLFSHLLSPESVVSCLSFIEKNGLSYVFTSLSSHEVNARRAAFHVLTRFYQHLEGAKFPEQKLYMNMMCVLRNSMEQPLYKIPCIISVFLSKASKLLFKPDDHMYPVINKYLLRYPDIDVCAPPLFNKIFCSEKPGKESRISLGLEDLFQNELERSWMLTLLVDGLTETADYKIYERRQVFKLLLSYYNSGLCDMQTQIQILKIVKAACSVRSILLKLIDEHGLFTWINGIINTMANSGEKMNLIVKIVCEIWTKLTDKAINKSYSQHLYQPVTITREILLSLQNLLMKSIHLTSEMLQTIIVTLGAVLEHQKSATEHLEDTNKIKASPVSIGLSCVCMLLIHACTTEEVMEERERFVRLLLSQGHTYHLKSALPFPQTKLHISEKTSDDIQAKTNLSTMEILKSGAEEQQSDVLESDIAVLSDNVALSETIISCCCHWNPKLTDVEGRKARNELVITGVTLTASWIVRHLRSCKSHSILQFSYWFNNFLKSISHSNKYTWRHVLKCCEEVGLYFEFVEFSSFLQRLASENEDGDEITENTILNVFNDILFTLGSHTIEKEELENKTKIPHVKYKRWFFNVDKQRIQRLSGSDSNENYLSSRNMSLFLTEFFHNAQNPHNTEEIMERYGLDTVVKKMTPKKSKKKK